MDAVIAEAAIRTFIAEIRQRLETATGIAKAAANQSVSAKSFPCTYERRMISHPAA